MEDEENITTTTTTSQSQNSQPDQSEAENDVTSTSPNDESDLTPTNSPRKRVASDLWATPSPKRIRTDLDHRSGDKWSPSTPEMNGTRRSTSGKNGPKYPLPVLEDSPRERPKLFIPKICTADGLRTPDAEAQVLVRLDSATPNKPLFIDNDPSLGVDFTSAANSPEPFPPSRQNSCNSLVRFSEKLFEDNSVPSDESLSLPDINDRSFTLCRSPGSLSISSDSSGIQMRQVSTPVSGESHCSDGFVINTEADSSTRETELSEKNAPSPIKLLETEEVTVSDNPESTQILDNETTVTNRAEELGETEPKSNIDVEISPQASINNEVLPIPSTSKCDLEQTRTKMERDTDLMFQQVQMLMERFTNEGLEVDPNDVFLALERYRIAPNRVELVHEELLQKSSEYHLHNDLAQLQARFHDVDTEVLRALIEKYQDNTNPENRMELVVRDIQANAALVHDPMFADVIHLMKIFPDRDKMEIYAYLKTKENEPNRVDLTAEMLLHHRQDTCKTNESLESLMGCSDSQIEFVEDVESLKSIFPDADRDYLFEQLRMRQHDPKRKEKLATRMAELRTYTKVSERIKKGKKRKAKFVLKEFVKMFPNALEFFSDYARLVNENYKRHARAYLLNYFTSITDRFIEETLTRHGGHLTPTFKAIRDCVDRLSRDTGDAGEAHLVFAEEPRSQVELYPEVMEELIAKEIQFLEHEGEIINYITLLAKEKQRAKDAARISGDLMECQCCYDDEVLFEEMQACEEGHPFCIECIRMSVETSIGEGKTVFSCLSENCESQFPLTVLKQILRPEILAKVLQRLQEEEIRLAGIENLVACPFCPFATIMDDEMDRVFRCQNPECLKESCRFCRDLNHVPMTCEEAHKDCTDLRTFVEERVSEAMIRICSNCGKRFYKNEGCNKITCTCGATMCYVCRQPNIGYDHFEERTNRCYDIESEELHRQEMEKAGRHAYEEYVSKHPETIGKYDLDQLLDDICNRRRGQDVRDQGDGRFGPVYGDNDDDDDDEDMDDEEEEDMDDYDLDDEIRRDRYRYPQQEGYPYPQQEGYPYPQQEGYPYPQQEDDSPDDW